MVTQPDTIQTRTDLLNQAKRLANRLERISADSIWAHRSSGNRGALLRWIDYLEVPVDERISPYLTQDEIGRVTCLIQSGYAMLERAARERIE